MTTKTQQFLVALYAQHAANSQRVVNGHRNIAKPFITKIIERIESLMLSRESKRNNSLQNEQKLANAIKSIVADELKSFALELKSAQDELLLYELEWEFEQISSLLEQSNETVNKPAVSDAKERIKYNVMQTGGQTSATRNEYLQSLIAAQSSTIKGVALVAMQGARELGKRQTAASVVDAVELYAKKTLTNEVNKRVQTIATHVQSQARQSFAVANENIMDGFLFAAVLDILTSKQCVRLDGRIVSARDKNLKFWQPPLHPNCRSLLIPNIKSNLVERQRRKDRPRQSGFTVGGRTRPKVDRTGDVYLQALKKLPEAAQNEVLGKTMAEIFRRMDYKEFARQTMDKKNRPYSLKELKSRDSTAARIYREILGE